MRLDSVTFNGWRPQKVPVKQSHIKTSRGTNPAESKANTEKLRKKSHLYHSSIDSKYKMAAAGKEAISELSGYKKLRNNRIV